MAAPGGPIDPYAAPWSWAPDHWGVDPAAVAPPEAPPITAAPMDLQPGLGVPSSALDSAVPPGPVLGPQPEGAPPLEPPPGPPLGLAAAPIPPPAYAGAPAAPVLGPANLGEPSLFPPPIEPERIDTAPIGGMGAIPAGWDADPLHAPDAVAKEWADTATPQQVLERQGQIEEARRTKLVLDQAKADQDNLKALRDDIDARNTADAATQKKSDQIVTDAIALASKKVDPDHWMSTRTVGQKIAAFVAAIVGGLVQGKTGSARNAGMDMIQQHIDRDIDAQKADIENGKYVLGLRQNQVAQEFKRTGDMFHATEAVRLATYQAVINKMQTEQQNFDPKGTRWLTYATGIQDMRGRAAAKTEENRKTIFEENYKVATIDIQRQNAARELWKAKQDVSLAWAREDREAGKDKADATVWNPQQLGVLNPGLPLPPIPMSQANYTKWLGTQKEGAQATDALRKNTTDDRARRLAVGEVVDDQGKPVEFRDEAVAGKIADSKGAVDSATHLIDKILAARQRYGWSSDLLRSPEWRQMNADYGSLVLQKKTTDQLGVLSESDMELIGKSLGTTDPTEARDPTAGLRTARENMINNVNATIRGQAVLPEGRKLQRWEPPAPPPVHRETPSETAAKEVLGDPWRDWEPARLNDELGLDVPALVARGARGPDIDHARLERYRELGGILPSQRGTIDGWAADLASPDAKVRAGAMQHLRDAADADRAPPGVAAYAQAALTSFTGADLPGAAGAGAPAREITQETTPPKVYPPVGGP